MGFDHRFFHQERSTVAFAVTEALIVSANVVGMIAGYSIDTGLRRSYLQQRQVEREQQRSDALLLNVLLGGVAGRGRV